MSKVYVATSFQNITEARVLMLALEQAGHTVTHDWTTCAVDPSWPAEQQAAYLQDCGRADYNGVYQADAVVLINHTASRDAMFEFGAAVALGLPTFVLYPERRVSVFFHKAHLCADMTDLLAKLGAS